jgi:hypothetical protein
MFMCFVKRSSVINLIYSGQQLFSFTKMVIKKHKRLVQMHRQKERYTDREMTEREVQRER